MSLPPAVRSSLKELAALALPVCCAACGRPDAALCPPCGADLAAGRWPRPRPARPDPAPSGMPPAWAATPYEDTAARLVSAYKDHGRRDLAPLLAPLLGEALDTVLAATPALRQVLGRHHGPLLVVPVPSSRSAVRRRGDAPLERLARLAVAGFAATELVAAPALRLRRRVGDQSGLGAAERRRNLEHAMEVRRGWVEAVGGSSCLVVDDVLTTGATLVEARRALLACGAEMVAAATICATERRSRLATVPAAAGR